MMLFAKPKRIRTNVMLDADILDTLDAMASLNGSSRSHLLNELLRPSIPALQELIELSVRMQKKTPKDETLKALDNLEAQLTKPVQQIPEYLKGLEKE